MNTLRMKRIYETPSAEDGRRILVDRLWPRGVSKERAALDEWAKEITPSTEIRKEFNHDPDRMKDFEYQYTFELNNNERAIEFIDHIKNQLEQGNVTLLYAARNKKVNHVVILKKWIEEHLG